MREPDPYITVGEGKLKGFCAEILTKLDVPPADAIKVADNLVEADLRGVSSHGVIRFPIYAQRLRVGLFNPRPKIHIVRENATTAVVDGDNGMGQLVGLHAMQLAIAKGRSGNCAFVSATQQQSFRSGSLLRADGGGARHGRLGLHHGASIT